MKISAARLPRARRRRIVKNSWGRGSEWGDDGFALVEMTGEGTYGTCFMYAVSAALWGALLSALLSELLGALLCQAAGLGASLHLLVLPLIGAAQGAPVPGCGAGRF